MQAMQAILIVVAVAVAGLAAWYLWRHSRTHRLRSRFGPEYERTVHEYGNRDRAEHDLVKRQKRREKLHIQSLPMAEREHYAEIWKVNQARFVDDPRGSVLEADELVTGIMQRRGYPVSNFERRVEDISVDHPRLAENYRAARDIVERYKIGRAGTEDLRRAMVCYRALFEELVEVEGVRK
jgi:hypothetical protein